ncbi:MAG: aminodeoxychorismate synthase component I, partial [Candidatus Margulisbacteria bacterium]|nr:aminodeoxychorismate synthase component I [Candidatus Margulisiibacteriota bacterium]
YNNVKKQYDFPLCWFAVFRKPESNVPSAGSTTLNITQLRLSQQKQAYSNKIKQIKQLIKNGFTYQVNYTLKQKFTYQGNPWSLYQELKEKQSTKYSAYIETNDFSVLSLSPELFFKQKRQTIEVQPMKGTISRGLSLQEDEARIKQLKHDRKNRAENLMIVDLLRNDLGKICQFGSVVTKSLFDIEKYETLFQMTSKIVGKLKNKTSFVDILKTLFPSGSVTGAPKIETIKIIRRLEKEERKVYTGAIGYLSPQETVFNVAIRTIIIDKKGAGEMGIGGGITYSSSEGDEYGEALLKGKFLSDAKLPEALIETMLYEKGALFLDKLHLERLEKSIRYLNFKADVTKIKIKLKRKLKTLEKNIKYKVRMLVYRNGIVNIDCAELNTEKPVNRVMISKKRINSQDKYLYHKTTNRELYNTEHNLALKNGFADVIFINERGEIAEGAISNVILEIKGRKYTPSLAAGLLPGVYREYLLKSGEVSEKIIKIKDLREADAIYLCNSVKKMWPVILERKKVIN